MALDLEAYNNEIIPVVHDWWYHRGGKQWAEHAVPYDYRRIAAFHAFAHLILDPKDHNSLRKYTVDIEKPRVRRILDMLKGPNRDTILKLLELRYEQHHGALSSVETLVGEVGP